MTLRLTPLGPGAVEIAAIDLASPANAPALRAAFAAHPVLVLRGQRLGPRAVADFGRIFGAVETYAAPPSGVAQPTAALGGEKRSTPDQRLYICPEDDGVLTMTNETLAGTPLAVIDNAEVWHADGSHKEAPYRAVALHVLKNPAQGGETEFCDLRALYDALPADLKAWLIGQTVAHHWSKSRNPRFAGALSREAYAEGERVAALFPETIHPLLCRDALDGRPHLFVSPRFALRIPGLAPEISEAMLDALFAMMENPAFVYRHVWREGDLVLWDNRRTNHRVNAYASDDPRSRYRVTVSGEGPMRTYEGVARAA